jgi:two-component system OmpR family response regulator
MGFTLAKDIRTKSAEGTHHFSNRKDPQRGYCRRVQNSADDYVTKPFNSEELLYRVQAILKRAQKNKNNPSEEVNDYQIGKYHFNFPLRVLYLKENEEIHDKVKLSPKEAQLLKMFCEHRNNILARSEALSKIWGEDNYFTARSMDVFVTKLRKYLANDSNIEISNIHGNGFRMIIHGEEGSEL